MAILGFPSSAIIGNLDWAGVSSQLTASGTIQFTSGDGSQWDINGEGGIYVAGNLTLSGGDTVYITGDYGATLYSHQGDVAIQSFSSNVTIAGAAEVTVTSPNFKHYGAKVATQPFSIAMAIALG